MLKFTILKQAKNNRNEFLRGCKMLIVATI